MRPRGITPDAAKIALKRKEKEWTQARLALKAHIQVRTVVTLEQGKPVARHTLERVAEALDVPVDDLLGSDPATPARRSGSASQFEVGKYRYFRHGIDNALFDLKQNLLQEMQNGNPILIRWLGLTMRYGASILSDFCDIATVPVHFELAMLAPTSKVLKTLGEHWPQEATGNYATLISYLRRYSGGQSPVSGELYVYDEQPHIHGFSINKQTYYVSWAGYDEHGSFQIVGDQGYDCYEAGSGRVRDDNRITLFDSWFEHFCRSGQKHFPQRE